jgi:hypothetical protein
MNVSTNVPLGEEPEISIRMPDGNVRETVLARLAPAPGSVPPPHPPPEPGAAPAPPWSATAGWMQMQLEGDHADAVAALEGDRRNVEREEKQKLQEAELAVNNQGSALQKYKNVTDTEMDYVRALPGRNRNWHSDRALPTLLHGVDGNEVGSTGWSVVWTRSGLKGNDLLTDPFIAITAHLLDVDIVACETGDGLPFYYHRGSHTSFYELDDDMVHILGMEPHHIGGRGLSALELESLSKHITDYEAELFGRRDHPAAAERWERLSSVKPDPWYATTLSPKKTAELRAEEAGLTKQLAALDKAAAKQAAKDEKAAEKAKKAAAKGKKSAAKAR